VNDPEAQIHEHEWIEDKDKQETEYETHPVSRSHTVADYTTCFYTCRICGATKSEGVRSEWHD